MKAVNVIVVVLFTVAGCLVVNGVCRLIENSSLRQLQKPGITQPDNHRIALNESESYGTLVARFTHSANLAGEGVVMMHFTDHVTKRQWLLISLNGCTDTVCVDVTPVEAEKKP